MVKTATCDRESSTALIRSLRVNERPKKRAHQECRFPSFVLSATESPRISVAHFSDSCRIVNAPIVRPFATLVGWGNLLSWGATL